MIPVAAAPVAAALAAATAGILSNLRPLWAPALAAAAILAVGGASGVLHPGAEWVTVIAPAAWIWVGVVAAQRAGFSLLARCGDPLSAAAAGFFLGGWVAAAAIVAGARTPARAARLGATAWLAAAISPVGNTVGWYTVDEPGWLRVALPTVVISIALMRPPTLVEPPSVPTRPREAWLAVAALLAGLVHATGLAWHAGEWFAVLPPAAAYAWGLLAGTVADPSLAATVIDRADALAPAAAHPALRAAWLGVACAPGLLTGLILARFGRAGLRGLPWLLVPPAVGAAVLWITGT